MKKRILNGILLLFCLLLFAVPMTASAKTVTINVKAKKGSDITKKLQQALDKGKKKKSNTYYEINVPEGEYKVSKIMYIYSNTTLNLDGVTLTRKKAGNVMLRFGGNKKYKGYSQCKNIVINGGIWDGNGKSADIMRFGHGENIQFNGVTFRNPKNSHHIEIAACQNVVFKGCTFEGFTGDLKSITDHEALQIDIMRKEHFDYYPAYDETTCKNITVDGCTFRNLQRGVGSHSSVVGSNFYNINIVNNIFENISGYAVIGMNYVDSKVNNNTITNCGLGIRFRTTGSSSPYAPKKTNAAHRADWNSEIMNNKISITAKGYQTQASGIVLYGGTSEKKGASGEFRISNVKIEGNEIYQDCYGALITIRDVDRCIVNNNHLICNFIMEGYTNRGSAFVRVENGVQNQVTNNRMELKVNNAFTKNIAGIRLTNKANYTEVSGNVLDDSIEIQLEEIACENNIISGVHENRYSE